MREKKGGSGMKRWLAFLTPLSHAGVVILEYLARRHFLTYLLPWSLLIIASVSGIMHPVHEVGIRAMVALCVVLATCFTSHFVVLCVKATHANERESHGMRPLTVSAFFRLVRIRLWRSLHLNRIQLPWNRKLGQERT